MKTLRSCSDALISGNKLTLTEIGRNLTGTAYVKHKIKRIDRLLKNVHLYNERIAIYHALAHPIISSLPTLAISVDWSGAYGNEYHLLRASLLVDELKEVIGSHPNVTVVTDGGFLTPWYSKVRALDWHVVGRLRGTMKCKLENQTQWQTLKQLRVDANGVPRPLGNSRLTQHSPSACDAFLHLYHIKDKGGKGKSRFTKDTKMYKNLAKEPLLLATSDKELMSK